MGSIQRPWLYQERREKSVMTHVSLGEERKISRCQDPVVFSVLIIIKTSTNNLEAGECFWRIYWILPINYIHDSVGTIQQRSELGSFEIHRMVVGSNSTSIRHTMWDQRKEPPLTIFWKKPRNVPILHLVSTKIGFEIPLAHPQIPFSTQDQVQLPSILRHSTALGDCWIPQNIPRWTTTGNPSSTEDKLVHRPLIRRT